MEVLKMLISSKELGCQEEVLAYMSESDYIDVPSKPYIYAIKLVVYAKI